MIRFRGESCERCHRELKSLLDGYCTPCRRHLGLESYKPPKPEPKQRQKRTRRNLGLPKGNPTRRDVVAAYRAAVAAEKHITGRAMPSLPRVKWLERKLPCE